MANDQFLNTYGQAANPDFNPQDYAKLQQAQAIGQALMQSGLTDNPQGSMVSGHFVAPSGTQYMAKLANLLAGRKMSADANAGIMQTNINNQNAMLARLGGQGQPAGRGGYPVPSVDGMSPAGQVAGPGSFLGASLVGQPTQAAGGQPQGSPFPVGGAVSNPFTGENVMRGMVVGELGGPDAGKAYWARTAPAPTQDQLNSRDPLIGASVQGNLATQNMTPEQKLLDAWQKAPEGSPMKNVLTGLIQKAQTQTVSGGQSLYGFGGDGPKLAAVAPTNSTQYAVGWDGTVAASGIPGAPEVAGTMANAEEAGKGNVEMVQTYNPQTQRMELMPKTMAATAAGGGVQGNNFGNLRPQGASTGFQSYSTPEAGLSAIDQNLKAYGAKGINTLSGVISRWAPPTDANGKPINNTAAYIKDVSQRLGINPNQPIDLNNPAIRQAIGTGIMLHEQGSRIFGQKPQPMAAGPRLGDTAGATAQANDSMGSWAKLQDMTRQAQTTTSYLQNINDLAQKAIVGPASAKLSFANGLLSLIPGTTRANDAQTANNLLDKYSSQIVARLGAGGMGTDSARTILQSAYPGAHMTADAIHEAVANLVGSNEMVKAKATLLAPFGNGRDYVGYQKAEMAFDKNADPRIWQYKAMRETNPQAAQVFLKNTLKQDPHFIDKADALSKLGAF